MTDPISTCKAVAVIGGGAVAVECAKVFMGIPRDVLYAALAGACIGLARKQRGDDWQKFIAPSQLGFPYLAVIGRSVLLLFMVAGNALVCGWIALLMQFLPLAAEAAKVAPMAVAGVLSWASWTLLPSAIESLQDWLKRKAGGQ